MTIIYSVKIFHCTKQLLEEISKGCLDTDTGLENYKKEDTRALECIQAGHL